VRGHSKERDAHEDDPGDPLPSEEDLEEAELVPGSNHESKPHEDENDRPDYLRADGYDNEKEDSDEICIAPYSFEAVEEGDPVHVVVEGKE
jgi:hypothetical protein